MAQTAIVRAPTDGLELAILPTMGWVCRTLGVSEARVWSLVKGGKLKTPTRKGTDLVFDEDEVTALAGNVSTITRKKRRDEGELYAVLFEHFTRKTPFARIVIEEKVSPETVRKAYEEFLSGFMAPQAPAIDKDLRAKLEVLSRKERIKVLEVELAEARGRNRDHISSVRAEAEKAKAHERVIKTIMRK